MLRQMLTSKIHRATVTQADLHYVGSVTVDEDLLDAADLYEGERIERAFAAVQAAEATEDETMVEAAYAHYDKALTEVIDANDLEPVVQALESVLFTSDPDLAAEN